jgi:hypothetical protein
MERVLIKRIWSSPGFCSKTAAMFVSVKGIRYMPDVCKRVLMVGLGILPLVAGGRSRL